MKKVFIESEGGELLSDDRTETMKKLPKSCGECALLCTTDYMCCTGIFSDKSCGDTGERLGTFKTGTEQKGGPWLRHLFMPRRIEGVNPYKGRSKNCRLVERDVEE